MRAAEKIKKATARLRGVRRFRNVTGFVSVNGPIPIRVELEPDGQMYLVYRDGRRAKSGWTEDDALSFVFNGFWIEI